MFTNKSLTHFPRRTVRVRIDYEPGPDDTFDAIHDTATLREISGTDRDRFESWTFSEAGGQRKVETMYLRARLVALCWIDEEGHRCYADERIEEAADALPSSVLDTLFKAAQKLNGLDGAAAEDAAKNSGSAATGASGTASPSH
jgi:hypothetical protein